MATLVRTIFAQPSAEEVGAQLARVIDQLESRFPDVARMLEAAGPDIAAFASFPTEHWRQIWSNNPQERLNREIRRRSDVVGIFPDRSSVIRLVGAVLAEQHDEWQVAPSGSQSGSQSPWTSMDFDDLVAAGWLRTFSSRAGAREVRGISRAERRWASP